MATILEPMGLIRRFTHNVLGWHDRDEQVSFDGCSFVSRCRYCGGVVLLDSQGNWFLRDDRPESEPEKQ